MGGSVGSEDGDIGFQIAPMVDVVFVLMLFFMASAGMQVVEKELSINLPSGATASQGANRPCSAASQPSSHAGRWRMAGRYPARRRTASMRPR